MYQERTIHAGFVGSLFLLATLILFFFHTQPAQNEIAKLQASVAQLSTELETIQGKQEALPTDEAISEIERKDLAQAIPNKMEQDQVIRDLHSLAVAADVTIHSLTFSLDKKSALAQLRVSTGVQGSPPNMLRFLKMLEVNPRKLVIRDAAMNRADSAEGLPLVNLNATIIAFYRYANTEKTR